MNRTESLYGMEIVIPIPPITKKNHQRIIRNRSTGAPMVMPSEQYKRYEEDCGWFLNGLDVRISDAVNVRCIFYMPTMRRCDLTNLLESIDDILVKYGVLADDSFKVVAGHDGSRVRLDRENPRTEILITRMEDCFEDASLTREKPPRSARSAKNDKLPSRSLKRDTGDSDAFGSYGENLEHMTGGLLDDM